MYGKSPKQWTYSLYDGLDRPVETGIMTYNGTREALQTHVNGLTFTNSTRPVSGNVVSSTQPDLLLTTRENGRTIYQASNSIVFQADFVSEDNAVFTAEIVTATSNAFSNNLSVTANPLSIALTSYPLTLSYYDTYSNFTGKTYTTVNNSKLDSTTGVGNYPVALPPTASTLVTGMVTVTKVRVLENPDNLSLGKWMERRLYEFL